MFKLKKKLSPEITSDILIRRTNNHNNLRHTNHFETVFVRSVSKESILYLGSKIWDSAPAEYKKLNNLR